MWLKLARQMLKVIINLKNIRRKNVLNVKLNARIKECFRNV